MLLPNDYGIFFILSKPTQEGNNHQKIPLSNHQGLLVCPTRQKGYIANPEGENEAIVVDTRHS